MELFAIKLGGFYLLVKLVVRFWAVRPGMERPGILCHREVIQALDLVAVISLIGAIFLLINAGHIARGIWLGLTLTGYDLSLRWIFLHREVKRLQEKSNKRSYRSARRQVQRRTLSDTSF